MTRSIGLAFAGAAVVGAGAAFLAAQGHAALPPQYDRWNEFQAVLSANEIPQKLGITAPADRIERVAELSYRVYGGQCFVPVKLAKRAPAGPQGQPIVGGSVVSVAEVGEPSCK